MRLLHRQCRRIKSSRMATNEITNSLFFRANPPNRQNFGTKHRISFHSRLFLNFIKYPKND